MKWTKKHLQEEIFAVILLPFVFVIFGAISILDRLRHKHDWQLLYDCEVMGGKESCMFCYCGKEDVSKIYY